jgi:hypothetical protein
VEEKKKKERLKAKAKRPFSYSFFHMFDNVLCMYVYVSRARKKQIKNSSIGSNCLRLYTWQHQSIQHTFGLFDINNQTIGLPFLLNRSPTIVSFVSSFVVCRQLANNIQRRRQWNQINYSSRYYYRFNRRNDRPFFNGSWKKLVATNVIVDHYFVWRPNEIIIRVKSPTFLTNI